MNKDPNIEDRKLCPDGSCVGVLDETGNCPICGPIVNTAPRDPPKAQALPRAPIGGLIGLLLDKQVTPGRRFARAALRTLIWATAILVLVLALARGCQEIVPYMDRRDAEAAKRARERAPAEEAKARSQQRIRAWYSSYCRTTRVDEKERCFFCKDTNFPEVPVTPEEEKISKHLGGPTSIHYGVTFCREGTEN